VLTRLRARGEAGPWLVAATAHPAKFETIVEPLVGHVVEPPEPLRELLTRPAHATPLAADYAAFRAALLTA
jgi:threonine synthase